MMPSTIHLSAQRAELGQRVDRADDGLFVELVDPPLVVDEPVQPGKLLGEAARRLAARLHQ